MAEPWTLAAPAGKTPEELNAIIDQLGSESAVKDRLLAAGATPPPEDLVEKMATVARRRRAMQEILAKTAPLGQFDTKLAPPDEAEFQKWKATYRPHDSGGDYDLRGAYKAGLRPDPERGHFPDTFKKPSHPTFSVESQYAGARPDLAGKWDEDTYIPPIGVPVGPERRARIAEAGDQYRELQGPPDPRLAPAEAVEPGVTEGMGGGGRTHEIASLFGGTGGVDPIDMLTAGATTALRGAPAAAGRAALQTGASEALASGASNLAGVAGLPPWLQSGIGILAGLAPLPGSRAPRSTARIPDEILPPEVFLPANPPAPGVRRPAFFTGQPHGRTIRQPYDPRFERLPEPGPRIPEERGLPAPKTAIEVSPEGVATTPEQATPVRPMEMPVKREFEQRMFEQPRMMPPDRGVQPGGEPKNMRTRWEANLPPDPQAELRAIAEGQRQLPEAIAKGINPEAGQHARLVYGNVQRRATSPSGFNPYTLPSEDFARLKQMQQELRQFGAENLPSRAKLSRAEFSERLERQRQTDHDNAIASYGPRSNQTTERTMLRARTYAAGQIGNGDRVMTPQGPGTVIGGVEGAPTSQQIRERLDWQDPTFRREAAGRAPRFARARTTSVRIRLDDGREDAWSAWNVVRMKGEEKIAGKIPTVDELTRAKIAKLKPRKSREDVMSAAERAYWKKRDAEEFGPGSASESGGAESEGEEPASFFDEDLPPPKR